MTSSQTNQSIEKCIALLELLDSVPDGLGIREIARRLELHPSNVQRLVHTLVKLEYVEQVPVGSQYRLGLKAYFLGQSYMRNDLITAAAMPEMERISSSLGLSTYLAVRRHNMAAYLHYIAGTTFMSVPVSPGDQLYLHSTALGKALISEMTEPELRNLLGDELLPERTPLTIRSFSKLMTDLEKTRSLGYSLVVEEDAFGIVSIGIPLRDNAGSIVAALSVALPLSSNLTERIAEIAPIMMAASANVRTLARPSAPIS